MTESDPEWEFESDWESGEVRLSKKSFENILEELINECCQYM